MKILILGASSELGRACVQEFAANNTLILTGRDSSRLALAAKEAQNAGAIKVVIITYSLEQGEKALLLAIKDFRIDIVINAASSVSRLRDSAIEPGKIFLYTAADLLTPVELVELLTKNPHSDYTQETPLRVIFISSILTEMRSPNRVIYSSYKLLQEAFLKRLSTLKKNGVQVTIVKIGTLLNRNEMTIHHRNIAKKVARLYHKKSMIYYGISGRVMVMLYGLSPFITRGIIATARHVRMVVFKAQNTEQSHIIDP